MVPICLLLIVLGTFAVQGEGKQLQPDSEPLHSDNVETFIVCFVLSSEVNLSFMFILSKITLEIRITGSFRALCLRKYKQISYTSI